MKCKNLILILSLLVGSIYVNAQNEVPELITDRPDQTESSTVVPHRSLQIETGFLQENSKNENDEIKSFAYNTTLLRYGLLDNFELRLGLEFLSEETKAGSADFVNTSKGLSPIYTGFKVKIADEDGWRPEMAFLGGLVLPFTASDDYKPEYSAADIRFSFAHTLSESMSLGYNFGAEWDGETAVPGYFYSLALGVGLTDKLGAFVEGYGLLPEDGNSEHMFDAGLTYLFTPNFQLDISGGVGINEYATDNFLSVGFTYRFLN